MPATLARCVFKAWDNTCSTRKDRRLPIDLPIIGISDNASAAVAVSGHTHRIASRCFRHFVNICIERAFFPADRSMEHPWRPAHNYGFKVAFIVVEKMHMLGRYFKKVEVRAEYKRRKFGGPKHAVMLVH